VLHDAGDAHRLGSTEAEKVSCGET
jgi:hypothetical protein